MRGISAGTAATSEAPTTTTSSVIPPGQALRGDGDADNPTDIDGNGDSDSASVGGPDNDNDNPTRQSYRFPDSDDKATFAYGHRPSIANARAIASIVKRYYNAARTGDGVRACSLLPPGFANLVAEAYGQAGPSYLRGGKTCEAVMSLLFRHFHEQLVETVRILDIRVDGGRARATIGSRKMSASSLTLADEHGSWKVEELLGQPLP
jgi:hypothetical protein